MTVPYPVFRDVTPVRSSQNFYSTIGKRAFDLLAIVLAAPIAVPLVLFMALVAWVQGGSPFYFQKRVGLGGREFRCWKIRTMVRDADAVLTQLVASDPIIAAEWTLNQKLNKDPRITRVGRFLRRSSLDELPQLLNVLNGTMSLIGPRPFTPDQKRLYADGRTDAAYYYLKPGITGLWQVSRRNAGSFSERVHFDSQYSDRMSLFFDIGIIVRTFGVVLRATGI